MDNLRGINTFDTERLSQGFQRVIAQDTRYVSLSRTAQPTVNAVGAHGCEFSFPPSNNIYLFHDIKCEMKLKLVTKDPPHATPTRGVLVGPVNNVLSSVISDVKLQINNQQGSCDRRNVICCHTHASVFPVIAYSDNYPYRCFMADQLNYDEWTKETQLRPQGWESE